MMMSLMFLAASVSQVSSPIIVTARRVTLPGEIVADDDLASMRGGMLLPNGISIAIGIDIQTRVDGLLALHTVYASEGSNPGIRVYTDGAKPVPLAPTTQTITAPANPSIPTLIVDRSPTGTTIIPTSASSATTVNLVNGDPSTWLSGEGQVQLPVTNGGPPVATPDGEVTLNDDDGSAVVRLSSDTLDVRHLVGQATGVVIANTANDRSIETVSSINVDVGGFDPGTLSGLFAAQRMVLESAVIGAH